MAFGESVLRFSSFPPITKVRVMPSLVGIVCIWQKRSTYEELVIILCKCMNSVTD